MILPDASGTRGEDGEGTPEGGSGDISVLALVNLLLRHRWLLVLLPLGVAAATVAVSLAQPRTWSSTVSFAPQAAEGSSGMRGLAGVAAQLGVSVPAQKPSESPAFYAELLRSPAILEPLVKSQYRVVENGAAVERDLISILRKGQSQSPLAEEEAMQAIESQIDVGRNRETGVISVTVRTLSPELSHQVADRLIGFVNSFDLERRHSRASAERAFVEQRVAESRAELLAAERELEAFLSRNRQFTNSPELQFQYDRLQRGVGMRQEVYTSLAQSYEQARVEEVRNLPVITVLQTPRVPARPDGRGTLRNAIVALVLGLIVAVLLIFARGLMSRAHASDEDDYREFLLLRAQATRDLLNPARGLARAMRLRRASVPAASKTP